MQSLTHHEIDNTIATSEGSFMKAIVIDRGHFQGLFCSKTGFNKSQPKNGFKDWDWEFWKKDWNLCFYCGLADTAFKKRYINNIRDFKHEKYESSTE